MKISDIKIGERHRKDLGDVKALAENIKHLGGLILPIVVSPDGLLLAGERRLAACKHLGWSEIPVTIKRAVK